MLPMVDIPHGVTKDEDLPTASLIIHNENVNHVRSTRRCTDNKLKLGSLVLSYVLGFIIETTALFVTSSNCFIFLVVTGILATLLQSWIALLQLRWGVATHQPYYSLVDFFLWFEASILCFHSGFFCAWAISDYLHGSQTQVVSHAAREMLCVAMCILCTRAVDLNRRSSQQPHHPNQQNILASCDTLPLEEDCRKRSEGKLKLASMTLSYILGFSTHMTAVLVMLTRHSSSFLCHCLLVTASIIATVFQSWITSMYFDWDGSSTWELALWLVASVLSSLSGFFCAWIVTDFWLGFQGSVTDHILLEILFVSKFLLLTWAICSEERSSPTIQLHEVDEEYGGSEYHPMMDIEHLPKIQVY